MEKWSARTSWMPVRTYKRLLVRGPDQSDVPVLVAGDAGESPREIVTESGLRFEVDFSGSYSPGLFCDQRGNREFLRNLAPTRVLNTFAYTCAFSVAAAAAGASTVSVDISKSSLLRGRRNFELNGIDLSVSLEENQTFGTDPNKDKPSKSGAGVPPAVEKEGSRDGCHTPEYPDSNVEQASRLLSTNEADGTSALRRKDQRHRFVAEDVPTYLARLARRGEKFDAIILDPPTFGRGGGRRTFQVERDFEGLIKAALTLATPCAAILLSTNCATWNELGLKQLALRTIPLQLKLLKPNALPDFPTNFPSGLPATSVWLVLN